MGLQDEMPVIWHQTKRQEVRPCPFHRLFQDPFERFEVGGVIKDSQPTIGTIENVVNQSTIRSPLCSPIPTFFHSARVVKYLVPDTFALPGSFRVDSRVAWRRLYL